MPHQGKKGTSKPDLNTRLLSKIIYSPVAMKTGEEVERLEDSG